MFTRSGQDWTVKRLRATPTEGVAGSGQGGAAGGDDDVPATLAPPWDRLREAALLAVGSAQDAATLEGLRVRFLGRHGEITTALRAIGNQPPAERPAAGAMGNRVRTEVASALGSRETLLTGLEAKARLAQEAVDISLPGRRPAAGHAHPLLTMRAELEQIFTALGFAVVEGPEVESERFNFEALNMPAGHPARDAHDSFYVAGTLRDQTQGRLLLRTHTSPVQIRHMLSHAGTVPVRAICPGRVYRRDDDSTHSPMFHQIEGLLVDHGISMAHLKGVLGTAMQRLFGAATRIRLRPSYFPFTEPSAELDVTCVFCGGSGCRTCKGSGWIELLGAGMVHPAVLAAGGYDPETVSGFAFGMGIDRCAMLRDGITHMRLLFEGDLRFLEQF